MEGRGFRAALGVSLSKNLERAAEYRAQAADLLRASERHWDERQRIALLDLAATYHRMAEQLEEMQRLDVKPLDAHDAADSLSKAAGPDTGAPPRSD
jgi:hypothetical protein